MTVATRAAEIARRDGRGAEGGEWGRLWDGFPIPSRVRGLGDRRELPQWGPRGNPGRNALYVYS